MVDPKYPGPILIEGEGVRRFLDRNMKCNFFGLPIEGIKALARRDPEFPILVFSRRFNVAALEACRVIRIVNILPDISVRWIKTVQASRCREPQYAGRVLTDVKTRMVLDIA